jgi:MFS transporter, DHA1 family, tetracycline resistance protein
MKSAQTTASASTPQEKRTLGIIFMTLFLDLMGFGIVIPVQPFYAQSLGANPALVTLLGTCFSGAQFLFAPLWGKLSDRVGRRPVILISVTISSIGYLIFALAPSLEVLFFARLLSGFGSANLGTAQAVIADITPPERRARGMGILGAAFGLGFIFGPAIGGFLSQFGLAAPAFAAAGLCGINFLWAFFQLPETYPPGKRNQSGGSEVLEERRFSLKRLREVASSREILFLFAIFFLFTTAFSQFEQVIGMFLEFTWLAEAQAAGTSAKEAALMTAMMLILVGVTATIVQGFLIGKLTTIFGERKLLMAGIVIVAISIGAIPFIGESRNYTLFLVDMALIAVGTGLLNPSLMSLLSRMVGPERQGKTLGQGQALSALGRVIGPASSGVLFERWIGLPFLVSGGLALVCLFLALGINDPSRISPSAKSSGKAD